jgi:flagella basal body P-ring formation protein FlgA
MRRTADFAVFVLCAVWAARFVWMRPPTARAGNSFVVLATATGLMPGQVITSDDIKAREMAAATVPGGARPDTPAARAELNGAVALRLLKPDDIILPDSAARVPPVPENSVASFAAAVRPGHVLTSADIALSVVARNAHTPAMIQPPEAATGAIVLKAAGAHTIILREDVLLRSDPGYDLPVVTPVHGN